MSVTDPTLPVVDDDGPEFVPAAPNPGSLEARVAERRKQLEARHTELFDVPGFEGVFKVELQMVGGKRQFNIAKTHEQVHDEYQKNLRTAADLLLHATVAFHSVDADGNTQIAEGCTWKKLAQAYDKKLDDATKGRVALQRLIGETGVIDLVGEWKTWTKTRGLKLERELEDF